MNQSDFIFQVQQFEGKMFGLARQLLISDDAAKDAVQDVLLKLWEKMDEIAKVKALEAYAMQMIKYHCFDQLKLKANQHLRIVHQAKAEESLVEEDHSEALEEDQERLQHIKTAMNELPTLQKMVMQLRDVENYSFEEIAEILDITEGAARVNLSRARKTVIQYIKNAQRIAN